MYEQVWIIFSIHRFFTKFLIFFLDCHINHSIINFYRVECGDGRQRGILVDNIFEFRGPKHELVPLPGFTQTSQSRVITFFALIRAFDFFSFQGQNNFISLMDIHVQHLASLCRICGDKIKDHMRKVDTNRFVSEVHQIWKDLLLLDSPNVHPQLKKSKKEDKFQL